MVQTPAFSICVYHSWQSPTTLSCPPFCGALPHGVLDIVSTMWTAQLFFILCAPHLYQNLTLGNIIATVFVKLCCWLWLRDGGRGCWERMVWALGLWELVMNEAEYVFSSLSNAYIHLSTGKYCRPLWWGGGSETDKNLKSRRKELSSRYTKYTIHICIIATSCSLFYLIVKM